MVLVGITVSNFAGKIYIACTFSDNGISSFRLGIQCNRFVDRQAVCENHSSVLELSKFIFFEEYLISVHKCITNRNTIAYISFKIAWPCLVTDSLWIRPTDALNSSFIGITTLHVSGSLSAHHQEFLAVHWLWYILCSCDGRLLPGAGWNCRQFHPAPGSKRSSQLHKMYQSQCTAKNSWWWAERLPQTCRVVIPIKLKFSASVGINHKETIVCV